MSTAVDVLPPSDSSPPPWADAWAHPEYYDGVTLRRVIAYMLDGLFIGVIIGVIALIFIPFNLISFGLLWPLQALLIAAVPFLYTIPLITQPGSATWGMRIMGIRVLSLAPLPGRNGCPTPLQAVIQTVGFYGSMAITGMLICLVALFNPRRRTLHDWMAGVVVVRDIPYV